MSEALLPPPSGCGRDDRAHRASLDDIPIVGKVARSGDLTESALRQIAAARSRHPRDFPLHEPVFAAVGTYLGPSELRTAIAHWSQQVDDASGVVRVDEQRRRCRDHPRDAQAADV